MRRMTDAVHLTESRCDGSAHGGCENACSLYWKEQWLKRVDPDDPVRPSPDAGERVLLPLLVLNTQKEPFEDGEVRYSCQATEMLRAAPAPLPLKDLRQYGADVTSGNVGVLAVLRSFLVACFNRYQDLSRRHLPAALRIRGGLHWRFLQGRRHQRSYADGAPRPRARASSCGSSRARRSWRRSTANLLNRGMGFDAEMSRFCGRTARVKARATRCVDERTGRMLTMKNPCIILEDIVCEGAFQANCPREFVCWWREIWLERVS